MDAAMKQALGGAALLACLGLTVACVNPSATSSPSGASSSSSSTSSTSSSSTSSGGTSSSAAGTDAGVPETLGPPGAEVTNALCSNGLDDDANGYADCEDYWCRDAVAVTVCDALENSAQRCTDAVDNLEAPGNPNSARTDGLVDCADPDCFKNPLLAGVCPALRFELGAADCADTTDNDGDTLVDCEDPDCQHASQGSCPTKKRVLFDASHREHAGSADWLLDVPGAHPWPSVPARESDWHGNLSAFGKDLLDTGRFSVESLPPISAGLTHGDATNPQDLTHFSVLILAEPSAPLADAESDAVLRFIRGGGGVLMVADHFDSDRDGNGWDSVQVFNAMLQRMGNGSLANNPLGFEVTILNYDQSGAIQSRNNRAASTVSLGQEAHPVLAGSHGMVDRIGMYRGGLFTVQPAATQVTVLMHALPLGSAGYVDGSPYVLTAQLEAGRVVAVGDSAILNDGSDSHGLVSSNLDSWHSTTEDNAALFLNAVEWLAP